MNWKMCLKIHSPPHTFSHIQKKCSLPEQPTFQNLENVKNVSNYCLKNIIISTNTSVEHKRVTYCHTYTAWLEGRKKVNFSKIKVASVDGFGVLVCRVIPVFLFYVLILVNVVWRTLSGVTLSAGRVWGPVLWLRSKASSARFNEAETLCSLRGVPRSNWGEETVAAPDRLSSN